MGDWLGLYRMVSEQHHGVLRTSDGVAFGLAERTLRRRAAREGWVQPWPATFLLPGTPAEPRILAYAAIRSLGSRTVLDRRSALAALGLGRWPTAPHLLLPHGRRHRAPPGLVVHRSRRLTAADVERRDGMLVTRVPRALLGLCADGTSPSHVRDLLIESLQRRLTSRADVVAMLERVRGLPGRPRLDRVVRALLADWVDSRLELDTRAALQRSGLQPFPAPFPLRCPDGRVVHLDVAFATWWHAVECDGAGAHMDRRGFETDRVRWGRIQRAGVTLTWVTRRRLDTDLDAILEELGAAARRSAVDPRPAMRPAHDCRRTGCR